MSPRLHETLLTWVDRGFRFWTLGPAVILLLALTVFPMINLVRMSLSTIEFSQGRAIWSFTPLRNLELLVSNEIFLIAIKNTLIFVVAAVSIEILVGFALALLVSGVSRGKGLLRTLMIIPILVPPVAIGSMWRLMYNFEFGVFNQFTNWLGIGPINWLGSTDLSLLSVIIVDIWHWIPFVFLILFAAVESLPKDVLEAARVDGATTWQTIRRVIIPMMKPALTVALIFRTILAFKVFDEVFLLTSGGPGTSSEVVSLHLYKVFFEQNELGFGATLSVTIILATVLFLATLGRALTRERTDAAA